MTQDQLTQALLLRCRHLVRQDLVPVLILDDKVRGELQHYADPAQAAAEIWAQLKPTSWQLAGGAPEIRPVWLQYDKVQHTYQAQLTLTLSLRIVPATQVLN